jgi:type 1 fimbria pilin
MKRVFILAALTALVLVASNAIADEKKEMKAEKKPVTLKGEIVDTGCYIAHGAMGEKHKDCATKCIANGMPMGLMTADGKLYLLTLDHDNADPYNQAKTMAGAMVEVTGTVSERNGMKAIDVTGVKPVVTAAATK